MMNIHDTRVQLCSITPLCLIGFLIWSKRKVFINWISPGKLQIINPIIENIGKQNEETDSKKSDLSNKSITKIKNCEEYLGLASNIFCSIFLANYPTKVVSFCKSILEHGISHKKTETSSIKKEYEELEKRILKKYKPLFRKNARRLAKLQEETDKILELSREVDQGIKENIKGMNELWELSQEVDQGIKENIKGMNELWELSHEVDQGIKENIKGMNELWELSHEVDQGIEENLKRSARNDEGINEVKEGIIRVEQGINEFKEVIIEVKQGINEVVEGIGQLDQRIEEAEQESKKVKEAIVIAEEDLRSARERLNEYNNNLDQRIIEVERLIYYASEFKQLKRLK